jgi:hypothetical protein
MAYTRCFRSPLPATGWTTALGVSLIVFNASVTFAQITYVPTNGPITVEGFMEATDATVCKDKNAVVTDATLPSGSFITQGINVRLDGKGDVAGQCDWYIYGSYYKTEPRNISKVVVGNQPPTLLPSSRWIYPNTPTQHLDSRVAGTTSGPDSITPSELGTYTFTFQTQALSTNCNIQPQWSTVESKTLNVVACIPSWNRAYVPPNDRTLHLPATLIRIYIPSTMWGDLVGTNNDGPAVYATNYWEAEMGGLGLDFQITDVPCDSYGGACVNVEEGPVVDGCASATPGVPALDGTAQTPGTIRLLTGWRTRPVSRNRRTMAHELAHLLGLNHNDCTVDESLMTAPVANCTDTTGYIEAPSQTDALPTKSTYTNGSLKVCGGL